MDTIDSMQDLDIQKLRNPIPPITLNGPRGIVAATGRLALNTDEQQFYTNENGELCLMTPLRVNPQKLAPRGTPLEVDFAAGKIAFNGEEFLFQSGNSIPSGCIVMWSGAVNNIPSGWALCDGRNGTPDLRNRFVFGAGLKAVGSTGGSEEVTLTSDQMPAHNHTISVSSNAPNLGTAYIGRVNGGSVNNGGNTSKEGANKPHNNMPPYYTLAFIMKL